MPGPVPDIHVFATRQRNKEADGRAKPGHDGSDGYLNAIGTTGAPTAPRTGSEGATKKKS
jgi:hypothetical protein